jgi:hypothetical protein
VTWLLALLGLLVGCLRRTTDSDEDGCVEDFCVTFDSEEDAEEWGRWFDALSHEKQNDVVTDVQTVIRQERSREWRSSIIRYVRDCHHRFVIPTSRPRTVDRRRSRGRAVRSSRRARAPSRLRQDDDSDLAPQGCAP